MKPRKRLLLWIAGAFAVLSAATILLLPIVTARILEDLLREQGASDVSIDNMDINPFTGAVALYGVNASGPQGRLTVGTLEVDASLWPLVSRRLEVIDLSLEDVHIDVRENTEGVWSVGPISLAGGAPAPEPESGADPALPWGLGLHSLTIDGMTVSLDAQTLQRDLEIQQLIIAEAFTWSPERPVQIDLTLHSEDAELSVRASATPFQETIHLKGEIELDTLDLGAIRAPALAAALSDRVGTLHARFEVEGDIAPGGRLALTLSGDTRLDDLSATLKETDLRAAAENLTWQGSARASTGTQDGHALDLSIVGEITARSLEVGERSDFVLAQVASLTATGLDVGLTAARVEVIDVQGLNAHLQRLADGSLRLPGAESGATVESDGAANTDESRTGAEDQQSAYAVRVGRLAVGGDSILHIRDEAVEPTFAAEFRIEELVAEQVDTASTDPLNLTLAASTSDADRLTLTGTAHAFASQPSATLALLLEGFDLSQLSPYIPGYNLERGRLRVEGEYQIDQGKLNLTNTVLIEKLKLAAKAAGDSALLAAGSAMPLDVMLDLLRDGDDRISLKIPITGSLDSIEVGFDQLIRRATQGALQKAALAYAKNALQPLGTILLVADLAGKAARPRFEPVEFAPGQPALSGDQQQYADKIGEMLSERPRLHLTLCGVATASDAIALMPDPAAHPAAGTAADPAADAADDPVQAQAVDEDTLLALAATRADDLRARLVSEHGVDPGQLFECRATVETAADAVPRVDVTL